MSIIRSSGEAEEWFSKKCWLEILGDQITLDPEQAERVLVMMASLQYMIIGSWAERRIAAHAVGNCVRACAPFTRAQAIAENMEQERRQRQRRRCKKCSGRQ